jgi:LemA protein
MKRRSLALLLPLLVAGCGYNRIQQLDEAAKTAQAQIQTQIQRRADLVPNLVEVVKGYAQHEEAVFVEVAKARAAVSGAVTAGDPAGLMAANAQMTGALGRLLVVAEAYPALKADQGFLRLQDELAGTENRIAVARTEYNTSVNSYNTYIRQFPAVLTAKVTGAKARQAFEVTSAAANEVPKVDFKKPPTP